MGIVTLPSFGSDPATINAAGLDGKVDPLATEFNGSIENANIAAAAAIAATKLNLATIAQNITHSGTMTHSGTVTMSAKDITEAKGADIASATTTECYAADGNFMHITGTTTITSLGTAAQAGDERTLVFDGALTLTHNATSLILPTGANITTAAGDVAVIRAESTANTRVVSYIRKDGTALVSGVTVASQANMETATDNTVTVTPLAVNWHPGVAKVWADVTHPDTVNASHNLTSITDEATTGEYTVTFATDFSSANNAILVTAKTATFIINVTAQAAGTCTVLNHNSSGVGSDGGFNLIAMGDQ